LSWHSARGYETPEQLAWTQHKGTAIVRLGRRSGAWPIPPEIASARHVILRTRKGVVAPGLFRLRVPGYQVFTVEELRKTDYPGRASGAIYALFQVSEDPEYAGRAWDGAILMDVLEEFESRMKHKPAVTLGRSSPNPRVLSLRELLKARK
jgi:hypothetical protein